MATNRTDDMRAPQPALPASRAATLALATLLATWALASCGANPSATTTTSPGQTSTSTGATSTTTTSTIPPASSAPPATTATVATSARTSTTNTTTPGTTTTLWRPLAPAPSEYQAASELLAAWSVHDRPQALSIATAAAVSALFALPVASVQQRGCSTPPSGLPGTCTYQYGAAQSILSLTVSSFPHGWGITAAVLEK